METETEPRDRKADVEPAAEVSLPAWKQAVLGAIALAFVVCAVAANFRRARLPLPQLGLFSRWEMFTNPPGGSILVVVGTPRDADPAGKDAPVMVEDPIDRGRPFLSRLRDQRQRKLHEKLDWDAGVGSVPARKSYLDHLCRREGGRFASLRIVLRTPNGTFGMPLATRSCEAP